MSWEECKRELRAHGITPEQIRIAEALRPEYNGHRKCPQCSSLHPDVGEYLHYCPDCGWCRHAVQNAGICKDCGKKDPPPVELSDDHFAVHWVGPDGAVQKVERR